VVQVVVVQLLLKLSTPLQTGIKETLEELDNAIELMKDSVGVVVELHNQDVVVKYKVDLVVQVLCG
jgi:hypothetical protein